MSDTYTCYTLVDVTPTGVNDPVRKLDYLQYQNFNSIAQTIGIRTQPENLRADRLTEQDLSNYQFGNKYEGTHTVWRLTWTAGRSGYSSVKTLIDDCNGMPIYCLLEETVDLPSQVVETTNKELLNTYFITGTV